MGSITLTAELVARGPAAAFVLDDEQVAIVGEGAKRFPARATINGAVLRATVTKMRGEYLFGLSRAAREQPESRRATPSPSRLSSTPSRARLRSPTR